VAVQTETSLLFERTQLNQTYSIQDMSSSEEGPMQVKLVVSYQNELGRDYEYNNIHVLSDTLAVIIARASEELRRGNPTILFRGRRVTPEEANMTFREIKERVSFLWVGLLTGDSSTLAPRKLFLYFIVLCPKRDNLQRGLQLPEFPPLCPPLVPSRNRHRHRLGLSRRGLT
jgi:hypothetical protein